jgi:hypothetical protein
MLILDKQKAVERVMALTLGGTDSAPMHDPSQALSVHSHARTYHRVATYDRTAVPVPLRRADRRRRRMRLLDGPSPA